MLALHKWVLQNTFVEAYSDFRINIEKTYERPHAFVVDICIKCALLNVSRHVSSSSSSGGGGGGGGGGTPVQLARSDGVPAFARKDAADAYSNAEAGRGEPTCPALAETMAVINGLDKHENHDHTNHAKLTWEDLYALDKDMATAAALLGREYGYTDIPTFEPTKGLVIRCGFSDQGPDKEWRKKTNSELDHAVQVGPDRKSKPNGSRWTCVLDRRGAAAAAAAAGSAGSEP